MPYHENYPANVIYRIKSNSVRKENGCLEYANGNLKHKYGLVSITIDGKRKNVPAHRAMYMAVNKCFDLPQNIYVRHKCGNYPCVEISHITARFPAK